MSTEEIISNWKGESKADAPAHPSGDRFTEISDDDLRNIAGGAEDEPDRICICIPCEGWITSISGECQGGDCNPF